jgi:predicted amidophosphoribosyltransferase
VPGACPCATHCIDSFQPIPAGSYDLFGLPATFDTEFPRVTAYCTDCQQERFAFHLAPSFGLYEGELARAILLLKHERIEPLGKWFLLNA